MMKMNGFSLEELDNMQPWEREVYTNLMIAHLQEQEKAIEDARSR